MSSQTHRIGRQVIELTLPRYLSGGALADEVSRIYRQRIVPLIEQTCDELAGPDQILRLDALALDLGTVPSDDLENELVNRVRTSLRQQLQVASAAARDQNRASGQATGAEQGQASLKQQSALELFETYVATGSLPWWTGRHNPGLLGVNLQQLLRDSPAALKPRLKALVADPLSCQRLASQYRDAQLAQLCALLLAQARSPGAVLRALIAALQRCVTGRIWPPARVRQRTWCCALAVAGSAGETSGTLAAFMQAVVQRIAQEMACDAPGLIQALRHTLREGKVSHGSALLAALPEAAAAGDELAPHSAQLLQRLLRLQLGSSGAVQQAWRQLHAQAARHLPAREGQGGQGRQGGNSPFDDDWRTLLAALSGSPAQAATQVFACLPRLRIPALQALAPAFAGVSQETSIPAHSAANPAPHAGPYQTGANRAGNIGHPGVTRTAADITPLAPADGTPPPAGGSLVAGGEPVLAILLRRYQSRGGALADLLDTLHHDCWQWPPVIRQHWLLALAPELASSVGPGGIATAVPAAASTQDAAALAAKVRRVALLDGADLAQAIGHMLHASPAQHGLRGHERSRLLKLLRAPAASAAKESVSIDNAGLVLLWPFLGSFFAHLGLLEERDFKSLAARQRAVGLLQILAAPQAGFAEYALPLNKLLCNLDQSHPFDFGSRLKKRETRECENLLQAVIAQAPILKNMSPDGLRGSFLLRPGMLSAQAGHWLLRVEAQTFDIVLDRLPWGRDWIKLPWMEAPLRVEWSI